MMAEHVVFGTGPLGVALIEELMAQGETVVRDTAELRVKETDRIATIVEELRRMGAEIEARPVGIVWIVLLGYGA